MLRINFTQEDVDKLHYERSHHPHPIVQKKMEVLYLKSYAPRQYFAVRWEVCQMATCAVMIQKLRERAIRNPGMESGNLSP